MWPRLRNPQNGTRSRVRVPLAALENKGFVIGGFVARSGILKNPRMGTWWGPTRGPVLACTPTKAHAARTHHFTISIQKTEPSVFERDVTPHGVRVVTVFISQPLSTTR